jgi:HD-like signal output (HDOD) protein
MIVNTDQLIERAGKLPPLPKAAQKALALIRDPNSSVSEVAGVLALDQVLASLILSWANSAYYGVGSRVSTVHQAMMILGQNTVGSLILTASVSNFLSRPLPGYELERGDLWKHAIGVAAGARLIAKPFGQQFAEDAYYAGLLCDIGKLAIDALIANEKIDPAQIAGKSFLEIENSRFGIDHATLGGKMARNWMLPDALADAITYHHQPGLAGEHVVLASCIHIADAAMMMMGIGIGKDGLRYPLDEKAFSATGWNQDRLEELVDYACKMIADAEKLFG